MPQVKDSWEAFKEKFEDGKVIPIFSNSFFVNRLFKAAAKPAEPFHFDEMIARRWADKSSYPFADYYDLANVAQYDLFRRFSTEEYTEEDEVLKEGYLQILAEMLKEHLKETDQSTYDYASEHDLWKETDISKFCAQTNLPRISGDPASDPGAADSIARLIGCGKVKGYLTTSYFDFLEQIFRSLKQPFCSSYYGNERGFEYVDEKGVSTYKDEFYDPERSGFPFIYHIFGHEKRAGSIVMCEDDHINFLIKVKQTQEVYKEKQTIIPEFIDAEIKNKTLLFLGYRWHDWEFRTIFRWIVGIKDEERAIYSRKKASVVVQFQPGPKELLSTAKTAQEYLQKYFAHCNLDIQWEDSEAFFLKLLQE